MSILKCIYQYIILESDPDYMYSYYPALSINPVPSIQLVMSPINNLMDRLKCLSYIFG